MLLSAVFAAAASIASACPTPGPDQPRKLALVVGIDDYGHAPGVPEAQQWPTLHGSANDAHALEAELCRRGFDVQVLLNDKATAKGIQDAFRHQLIERTRSGKHDVAYFHFSGHGQQVPDDNGDEEDGFDETIVPFDNGGMQDCQTPASCHFIRDDALGQWIGELGKRTDQIVVSLDSCHSGTATRGGNDGRVTMAFRGAAPHWPAAKTKRKELDADSGMVEGGAKGLVFLSAARAERLAAELPDAITGAPLGAFTREFAQALHDASTHDTWHTVLNRVSVGLSGKGLTQDPQIEGPEEREIFNGTLAPVPSSWRVRAPEEGGLLPVEVGSIHGIEEGSILGLFPPGETRLDPAKAIARAKVEQVELSLSRVRPDPPLTAESAKLFAHGGQAIELVSAHASHPLDVNCDCDAALRKSLDQALAGQAYARLKTSPAPSATAMRGAGVPNSDLRVLAHADSWSVLRPDGSVVPVPGSKTGIIPVSATDGASRLAEALQNEWKRRRLIALTDDPGSRRRISIRAERVDAAEPHGEDCRKAKGPYTKSGRIEAVKTGDLVRVTVKNEESFPLYVSVIEVSTDGSVDVRFPDQSERNNLLEAGKSHDLQVICMTDPPGDEVFKVFATEKPADFSGVTVRQRGDRGGNNPLANFLSDSLDGSRGAPVNQPNDQPWGTDQLLVHVAPH